MLSSFIMLLLLWSNLVTVPNLPQGRTAWSCTGPVIYPGWWNFKITSTPTTPGTVGGPNTIDGTRANASNTIWMNGKVRLYYLAEYTSGSDTYTNILYAEAPTSNPANFSIKGLAIGLPTNNPITPTGTQPSEGFYTKNLYYPFVLPALDANGDPSKTGGVFDPWYMYIGFYDMNAAVAKSTDGGVTFTLVSGKNPLFPYQVYQTRNASGVLEWNRNGVPSKSMTYDYTMVASPCVVKDGSLYRMYYTAYSHRYGTYANLGVTATDVGHPDGEMPDIGIGYAESTDGITFTRKTATQLGVTSSASDGGRVVAPRKWNAPNGLYEYVVSRPMVFRDGDVWRMMVSSHSTTYRARSLHSTDLINWTWDDSPAEGTFGFGAAGTFDSGATGYPQCMRIGNTYHCYYTGNGYGHYLHSPTGIGYCTAPAL